MTNKQYVSVVRTVLRAMVDRLETCEPSQPSAEYCRGVISCTAATVGSLAVEAGADEVSIDDVFDSLSKHVEGLNQSPLRLSSRAFNAMLADVVENYLETVSGVRFPAPCPYCGGNCPNEPPGGRVCEGWRIYLNRSQS